MHVNGLESVLGPISEADAGLSRQVAAATDTKPSTHGGGADPRSGRASAQKTETHCPHDADIPEAKRSGRSPYRTLRQSGRSTSREGANSWEGAKYVSAACGEAPCSSRGSCFGRCFSANRGGSPSNQSRRGAAPSNPGRRQHSPISPDRLAAAARP